MQETAYMARFKIALITTFLSVIVPAFALSNYRATYDLHVRGVGAGTITHDAFFTDVTYRIDTVANPSLAAKMLGFGEIRETVKGLRKGNTLQPQDYQRSMSGDDKYQLNYHFLPEQHQVQVVKAGERKTLSYDRELRPLDMLSMAMQAMVDLEKQKVPPEYTLVLEDNINTYQVQKQPDQTWKGHDGKNFIVHVYRQSKGNKQTVIYFAENPLRLVRLEQKHKGNTRFSMNLTSYKALQ